MVEVVDLTTKETKNHEKNVEIHRKDAEDAEKKLKYRLKDGRQIHWTLINADLVNPV